MREQTLESIADELQRLRSENHNLHKFVERMDKELQEVRELVNRQAAQIKSPKQSKPNCTSAEDLVRRLRQGQRDVYRSENGRLYVTRGGGQVSEAALKEALQRGLIRDKWMDTAEYWVLSREESEPA